MLTAGFFFLLGGIAGALVVWFLGRRPAPPPPPPPEPPRPDPAQAALPAEIAEMRRQLEAYQARITEIEKQRAASAAQIQAQLETVGRASTDVAQEARTLRAALATSSGVRGDWGETVLRNLLEQSGLHEAIDYDLQVVLPGGGRPDAIVYLPAGRKLVVDAKANLGAFLAGLEAADSATRAARHLDLAKALRATAKELAARNYPAALERSMPLAVMFVPSEGAFRAALDADHELFAYAQGLQPPVVLASPSTLFPILCIVAQGWQQQKAADQIRDLLRQIEELGKRLATFVGHLQGVGKGLDAANKAYAAAAASYRSRLVPQVAKLEELNAGWAPAPELKPLEHAALPPAPDEG